MAWPIIGNQEEDKTFEVCLLIKIGLMGVLDKDFLYSQCHLFVFLLFNYISQDGMVWYGVV